MNPTPPPPLSPQRTLARAAAWTSIATCVLCSGLVTYKFLSMRYGTPTHHPAPPQNGILVLRLGAHTVPINRADAPVLAAFLATVSDAPTGASLCCGAALFRVRSTKAMEAERRKTLLLMVRSHPQDPGWTLAEEVTAAEAAKAAETLQARLAGGT